MTEQQNVAPEGGPPPLGLDRGELRTIAKLQRGILTCILIYLIAVVGQFIVTVPVELRPLIGIALLLVMLAAAVLVFMLAMRLYGIVAGVLLGILTLLPIIGLIVLLVINGKATGILRQNGIKVGFMGANVASI